MSLIDIAIVVFALAMAASRLGARTRSLRFSAGGIHRRSIRWSAAGSLLLDGGAESPYAPAVAAGGGILLGLFLAIALEGVGRRLSARLAERKGTRMADS